MQSSYESLAFVEPAEGLCQEVDEFGNPRHSESESPWQLAGSADRQQRAHKRLVSQNARPGGGRRGRDVAADYGRKGNRCFVVPELFSSPETLASRSGDSQGNCGRR